MATNLQIDDALLVEAVELGGFPSKKAAVNELLREFVQRKKAFNILSLFGTVDFDSKWSYKAGRQRGYMRIRSGFRRTNDRGSHTLRTTLINL
ncbi:MAG: type II toxin-antitoxin system VapB family antitoxin [Verrucomicrobiota bacterium]|nr:type II toxin-antitoxin system VapB family antitoxin [Verrucomicrobiota bacterium]